MTKYLGMSDIFIIFVLKVGETHKVKKNFLNIKCYDKGLYLQ